MPLLGGTALLAAFWYAERRARDPLLPPRFLLNQRRALALTAIALSACATAMTFVVLSLHLQQARNWSPLQTSAVLVPFAVALISSGRAARTAHRPVRARAVTAAGLGTGAAGLTLLAFTGLDVRTSYAYGLLPGLVLLPAGTTASFAGAAGLATEGVPQQQTGLAGGVLNTAVELGPTVLFAVLLTLGSDAWSLAATGAALAVVALLNHRTK
ncbi:MFS transporter [Streptomyces sp. 8N616]|uniref:MFS transporter n=1 Tax=Streptomyces sp. 8N616 TaxID=3457414 RepID=UPI003FD10EB3